MSVYIVYIKFNSTFGVPKNSLELWKNSVGIKIKLNFRVCELHFKSDDIRIWVSANSQILTKHI